MKPLDPKYRIETYEYQWILNAKTIIEEVPKDEGQLEPPKYQLIPFNELDAYKNSIAEIGNSLFTLEYLIINILKI